MSTAPHWGEMPKEPESTNTPDIQADIERAMDKLFLNQFNNEDESQLQTEQITLPPMDPLVLHAISLHKYANNLLDRIEINKHNSESNQQIDELEMPELPEIINKYKKNSLNYLPKESSDFTLGNDIEVPELSKSVVREILTKCVATLFAQIGYETSQQVALEVMTDVLENFLKKICNEFKTAKEQEDRYNYNGFPNPMEKVLTQMGFGGIKGLHDYYQSRVIKYVQVLRDRCREHNEILLKPPSPSPVDKITKMVRVKVEEEDVVETENPEVHFSTIDGDVNFSILETGYQLLNSLEAETNLQTLGDTEEDSSVSDTSSVVAVTSETDVAHLSPFNKKKRFK